MSKQLTPEDLEKMSPQSLVEFMTENIPADKLRACLQKVEEFPSELPSQIAAPVALPAIKEEPVETVQIDTLRNKCKKYPIIVVKIDKLKGKEGDHVYFYKKKDGIFKLLAKPVEQFNKDNCNEGDPQVVDVDCNEIEQWIQTKIKDGVLDSTVKSTLQAYANSNMPSFISDCENVKMLISNLGIVLPDKAVEPSDDEDIPELEDDTEFQNMTNPEKLNYLKNSCIYKAGILIGDLVKDDNSKAVAYIAQKNKEDNTYSWKRFRISLDDLNNKWCDKMEREIEGSEKYRKYSLGFSATPEKTKKEMNNLVTKLKSEGINIPYAFLESGGSSFGISYNSN